MLGKLAKTVLPPRLLMPLHALDHYFRGEKEIRLLPALCDGDRSAVDVGANVGVYTYFLRRLSRSVHCYEPNPKLCRYLRAAFGDSIDLREAAVSDVAGDAVLTMPVRRDRPVHELATLSQAYEDSAEVVRRQVPTVRLDDEDLPEIGFLKIDVEQHERQVLSGAMRTIARDRPDIMTEVTPLLYESGLQDEFRWLHDLSYAGLFRFRDEWHDMERFDPETHADRSHLRDETRFMGNNVIFTMNPEAIRERWRRKRPRRGK